jgi:uncharacterized protein (TIGR00369 family)
MRRQITFDADRSGRCFGCGPANPSGLGLRFFETDDGAEVEYVVPADLEGAPGIVHGGIQATLLDEAMCMTAYAKAGTGVVTGELTVRYLHPVPTGTPLVVAGRITETRGRSFFIAGSIRLAAGGEELTRAQGRFFAAAPSDTQETTA